MKARGKKILIFTGSLCFMDADCDAAAEITRVIDLD